MIEERHIQLIQQELDGLNSLGESREVEVLLSTHGELKSYYDELREVFRRLNSASEIEPPPNLYERVINAIPFAPQARPSAVPDWWSKTMEFLTLRSSLSFSAGLVLGGLLIFFLFHSTQEADHTNLVGTLGNRESFVKSEPTAIQLKGIQGEAVVSHSSIKTLVEIHLKSERQIEATLEFDKMQLRFESFRSDEPVSSFQMDESVLHISHLGEGRYTILLKNLSPQPLNLELRIRIDGQLLFERTIE